MLFIITRIQKTLLSHHLDIKTRMPKTSLSQHLDISKWESQTSLSQHFWSKWECQKLLFLNIFDQNENAHNHRTDVRKLQDVRGHEAGVNIVLTNPDILQVCILLLSSYSPSTSSPSTSLSPTHISCRCAYSPQTVYSNYPHTHQQHQQEQIMVSWFSHHQHPYHHPLVTIIFADKHLHLHLLAE